MVSYLKERKVSKELAEHRNTEIKHPMQSWKTDSKPNMIHIHIHI